MTHYKRWSMYFAVVALTVLAGCAALGLPTADTFNQKLVAGYATVTAIRTTNTMLLDAKQITADDGANNKAAADAAVVGLDTARALSKTDQTAADAKLTMVRTALTALQTYLSTKGK